VRKRMALCAQKLKIRCAHKSDAAAMGAKLKAVFKLAIYFSFNMYFGYGVMYMVCYTYRVSQKMYTHYNMEY
jgi:hypothetical protein